MNRGAEVWVEYVLWWLSYATSCFFTAYMNPLALFSIYFTSPLLVFITLPQPLMLISDEVAL